MQYLITISSGSPYGLRHASSPSMMRLPQGQMDLESVRAAQLHMISFTPVHQITRLFACGNDTRAAFSQSHNHPLMTG